MPFMLVFSLLFSFSAPSEARTTTEPVQIVSPAKKSTIIPEEEIAKATIKMRRLRGHDICYDSEVYKIAADDRIVIWGIDSRGYSQRMISDKNYLLPNLNFLVNQAGWKSASGGGLTVQGK